MCASEELDDQHARLGERLKNIAGVAAIVASVIALLIVAVASWQPWR
jgi:hypothetical protein